MKLLYLSVLSLVSCSCPVSFREVPVPSVHTEADVRRVSDCQMQHYGTTLLAQAPDVFVARALMERGAQPNGTLIIKHQAQHGTAVWFNPNDEVVEYMLQHGADPNCLCGSDQVSPLCQAIREGKPKRVSLLLRYGADANRVDAAGAPPLVCLMRQNRLGKEARCSIMRDLLQHGALASLADQRGTTPLHLADVPMQTLLLQAGAQVDARDHLGRTPLFYASSPQAAQGLLQAGADRMAKDRDGRTAFDVASSAQVKSYLLIHGCRSGLRL